MKLGNSFGAGRSQTLNILKDKSIGRARRDSNPQPSDPKMSMGGVHGVLMKPEGLDPLHLKNRETARGLLSFLKTADHLTDLIFL
jgi:hypothetical protein